LLHHREKGLHNGQKGIFYPLYDYLNLSILTTMANLTEKCYKVSGA